ncbi:uncharacterized protein PG998_002427 [Apiospora kogelbergensis]|uniref:CENP-V/GFA domain-containing protein n=1 Tax=Apiospora kogelbergensis TaxID=1337665 RepID=A0AAW0QFG1_9PEZI
MSNTPLPHRAASCLCGAIRINVTGAPLSTYLCHCRACQKACGVVFSSNAAYQADHVQITFPKGDDPSSVLRTFEDDKSSDSGTVILRTFCAVCGSRLTTQRLGSPDRLVLAVGLFAGDEGRQADMKPTSEYFCVNRAAWLGEVEGGITRLDKMV